MRKLTDLVWFCICGTALGGLNRLFFYASSTVEPNLFANGLQSRWWAIVLLYWLTNTTVLLSFAAFARWPVDFRQSERVSFLQVASDLAVAVLYFHLAVLANDQILHERLRSVGLGSLPQFFLVIMLVWVMVGIFRYRRLSHADDTDNERISQSKRHSGRRTSIHWSPSWGRYRNSPK